MLICRMDLFNRFVGICVYDPGDVLSVLSFIAVITSIASPLANLQRPRTGFKLLPNFFLFRRNDFFFHKRHEFCHPPAYCGE